MCRCEIFLCSQSILYLYHTHTQKFVIFLLFNFLLYFARTLNSFDIVSAHPHTHTQNHAHKSRSTACKKMGAYDNNNNNKKIGWRKAAGWGGVGGCMKIKCFVKRCASIYVSKRKKQPKKRNKNRIRETKTIWYFVDNSFVFILFSFDSLIKKENAAHSFLFDKQSKVWNVIISR